MFLSACDLNPESPFYLRFLRRFICVGREYLLTPVSTGKATLYVMKNIRHRNNGLWNGLSEQSAKHHAYAHAAAYYTKMARKEVIDHARLGYRNTAGEEDFDVPLNRSNIVHIG